MHDVACTAVVRVSLAVIVLWYCLGVDATIVAKTSVNECYNYGGTDLKNRLGKPCSTKLVIALTVQGNEGKAQHLEAKVAKTTDVTSAQAKGVQLKHPVRVRISKSPVLINYRLYQLGYVNHMPYEIVAKRRGSSCRDDWFGSRSQVACGFQEEDGNKIFDSQGFCCSCKKNGRFDRGESINACHSSSVGHCLRFHDLNYYVFGFFPSQLLFNITIEIQRLAFTTKKGKALWETSSVLEIGPHKRRAKSKNFQVKAEYIADFYPSDFMDSNQLAHRYLLVPDTTKFEERVKEKGEDMNNYPIWPSVTNVSEWMAVPKHYFDFTGSKCNKIGVYYSGFKYQGSACSSPVGSCLQSQPHHFWKEDKQKQKEGRKGRYMLHNFGKVHSAPHHRKVTDYQVNFIATKVKRSLIVVSMVADNLQLVVYKSPARIVEAYVVSFEALSAEGLITVIIQNVGSLTATYQVFVSHCSAGVDMVPSQHLTLDPSVSANLSFTLHSFHAVGRINHCEVELYNQNAELLDNMTVHFETLDTCFCHGFCGCSCGENSTECPPPPKYDKGDDLKYLDFDSGPLKRIKQVAEFLKSNFGKFALAGWFMCLLILLGMLKVLHMLITGQIDFPALTEPAKFAMKLAAAFGEGCVQCCERCCECCQRYSLCVCATTVSTVTGETDYTTMARDDYWLKRGWRRPRQCDGMCSGAKEARRAHRKEMRINKRKGIKKETVWFQKPYKCTCIVKDTMPCLEICKGLFFFIYCPLLPVWWVVDFFWTYGRQKWRRHKRKKTFRERKAALRAQEEKTFLMLDQYTRGKVEHQIVDFDQEVLAKREKKSKKERKGFAPTTADLSSNQSSDTSDMDEAGGIDELVNPGCPVYLNYAYMPQESAPKSLQAPGTSFSIKGRLTEQGDKLIFDLDKYTHQVKHVVKGKPLHLKPHHMLTPVDFRRQLDEAKALKLVTLTPLFPCLNDTGKP